MNKRTLVIGDIHGGLKALQQVFERAKMTTNDTLIFLGDYVDGWSGSAQLIEYLIKLDFTHNCIFLKGNHDIWCENWLRTDDIDEVWLFNGGLSTIDSYKTIDSDARQRHLSFFEKLKYYEIDEKNRLYVHAGFTHVLGPQYEAYQSTFCWDRTLWEMAVAMDKRMDRDSIYFPRRLRHFEEIYIGHTPVSNYDSEVPMQACNVWNIDTSSAYMGKLSVMDVDTKKFWQSDQVISLYPGEVGRNKFSN
jgi:serine/threonine protein phosphatase 1